MKLRGKKLQDATTKALNERKALEHARAERDVANKVNQLMNRAKDESEHIVALGKKIDEANKRHDALMERIQKLKAGDPTGMDEPKSDNPYLVVDLAAQRSFAERARIYRSFLSN